MASRFSDPSWWPTPPPERPAPVSKIVVGTLIPLLAVVGAIAAVLTLGHTGHEGSTPAPAAGVSAETGPAARSEADRREAFADCVRGAGGANGGSARGRFGRSGPSAQARRAFGVCRSLLQPSAVPPAPPASKPGAAPVA